MGFSLKDGFDKKEGRGVVIDIHTPPHRGGGMDVRQRQRQRHHGIEGDGDFWPIEHPMEPPDEDRPVKCPMPDSSVLNRGSGGMCEKRFAESMRKRIELLADPPVRAVRKRHHHTLSNANGDHTMSPSTSLPPRPDQKMTIFQMLHEFES